MADNAAVNKKVLKYLIAESEKYKRLLVVASPCQAHYLSNATRWSLGGRFRFGTLLSFVHVLEFVRVSIILLEFPPMDFYKTLYYFVYNPPRT